MKNLKIHHHTLRKENAIKARKALDKFRQKIFVSNGKYYLGHFNLCI